MSDIFILIKNIDTGQFSIGKSKYIIEPVLPEHEDAIAETLTSLMRNKVIFKTK